jgi:hypothetical protein
VTVLGARITVDGLELTADLAFERTRSNGADVTKVALTRASLTVLAGGRVVARLANGSGLLLLLGAQRAGP